MCVCVNVCFVCVYVCVRDYVCVCVSQECVAVPATFMCAPKRQCVCVCVCV